MWPALVVLALIALAVISIRAHHARGEALLQKWAAEHGYRILSAEYRFLRRGPFFWRADEDNAVYRIEAEGVDGKVRRGYARCGGYWLGMWWSSKVTVEWD